MRIFLMIFFFFISSNVWAGILNDNKALELLSDGLNKEERAYVDEVYRRYPEIESYTYGLGSDAEIPIVRSLLARAVFMESLNRVVESFKKKSLQTGRKIVTASESNDSFVSLDLDGKMVEMLKNRKGKYDVWAKLDMGRYDGLECRTNSDVFNNINICVDDNMPELVELSVSIDHFNEDDFSGSIVYYYDDRENNTFNVFGMILEAHEKFDDVDSGKIDFVLRAAQNTDDLFAVNSDRKYEAQQWLNKIYKENDNAVAHSWSINGGSWLYVAEWKKGGLVNSEALFTKLDNK